MVDDVSGAWSRVAAFVTAVDASLDTWLGERYRLGLSEYRALALLARSVDRELRIAVLAQQVGLTSTSTTRLVSRLEGKGLAVRDSCPDDGRGVYAVLSDAGEALLREVREPFEKRLGELLGAAEIHLPHLGVAGLGVAFSEVGSLVES